MPIIGMNMNSMNIERKGPPSGKISINNSVNLLKAIPIDLNIGAKKEPALRFEFNFITKYDKDIAELQINGDVMFAGDKKIIEKNIKSWKEKKEIDPEIRAEVLNLVMARCNITALIIAREFNLPSPIPLPRIKGMREEKKE